MAQVRPVPAAWPVRNGLAIVPPSRVSAPQDPAARPMAAWVWGTLKRRSLLAAQADAIEPRMPLLCQPLAPGPMPLERRPKRASRLFLTSRPTINPSRVLAPERSAGSATATEVDRL